MSPRSCRWPLYSPCVLVSSAERPMTGGVWRSWHRHTSGAGEGGAEEPTGDETDEGGVKKTGEHDGSDGQKVALVVVSRYRLHSIHCRWEIVVVKLTFQTSLHIWHITEPTDSFYTVCYPINLSWANGPRTWSVVSDYRGHQSLHRTSCDLIWMSNAAFPWKRQVQQSVTKTSHVPSSRTITRGHQFVLRSDVWIRSNDDCHFNVHGLFDSQIGWIEENDGHGQLNNPKLGLGCLCVIVYICRNNKENGRYLLLLLIRIVGNGFQI